MRTPPKSMGFLPWLSLYLPAMTLLMMPAKVPTEMSSPTCVPLMPWSSKKTGSTM